MKLREKLTKMIKGEKPKKYDASVCCKCGQERRPEQRSNRIWQCVYCDSYNCDSSIRNDIKTDDDFIKYLDMYYKGFCKNEKSQFDKTMNEQWKNADLNIFCDYSFVNEDFIPVAKTYMLILSYTGEFVSANDITRFLTCCNSIIKTKSDFLNLLHILQHKCLKGRPKAVVLRTIRELSYNQNKAEKQRNFACLYYIIVALSIISGLVLLIYFLKFIGALIIFLIAYLFAREFIELILFRTVDISFLKHLIIIEDEEKKINENPIR